MMNMECPCRACRDHAEGCHGRCAEYKAWRTALDEQNAEKERLRVIALYRYEQINKIQKYEHKHRPKWGNSNG